MEDTIPMAQDMMRALTPAQEDNFDEMHRALAHYRRLQDHLEREAPNKYLTIDAETGAYTVGDTRLSTSAAFRASYGADRPGWTLHIGTT
jgi:hypothetical protein